MPAPRNEISRPASMFRDASSLKCATSSGSESGNSSASGRSSLTPRGICSNNSSTESTPIVPSICSRSCSVRERKLIRRGAIRLLLFEELTVGGRVEERIDLAWFREPDPYEPPLAVRILVDGLGRLDDLLIDLDHLARERRDQIRNGLDGLDLTIGVVPADPGPFVGRLEVDELPKRVLSEPRDSERRLATIDARPVVLRVVLE